MAHKIGERQRWAWLWAGASGIAAACLCGFGWRWVLLGSAAAAAYYIYLERRTPASGLALHICTQLGLIGKLLNALTLVWIVVTMGWAASLADAAFPSVNGFPSLGWLLLALAAWGSRKGGAVGARCCGVLSLFLLGLYGVIVGFAIPDIDPKNLEHHGAWTQALVTFGLCLQPA